MTWQQLIEIERRANADAAVEAATPPKDCEVCGHRLAAGEGGTLYCPFNDHYTWPE